MTESRTPTDLTDLQARWDSILRKLEANAHVLATQGTLVAKNARGRRVWAVRYVAQEGGRRAHKSVYIGDHPELIERARRLLEGYREPGRWAEKVEGYARLAVKTCVVFRRIVGDRHRAW